MPAKPTVFLAILSVTASSALTLLVWSMVIARISEIRKAWFEALR